MATFIPSTPAATNVRTRSVGTKFFVVMLLAVLMSVSGFFVEGLTTERSYLHGVGGRLLRGRCF